MTILDTREEETTDLVFFWIFGSFAYTLRYEQF